MLPKRGRFWLWFGTSIALHGFIVLLFWQVSDTPVENDRTAFVRIELLPLSGERKQEKPRQLKESIASKATATRKPVKSEAKRTLADSGRKTVSKADFPDPEGHDKTRKNPVQVSKTPSSAVSMPLHKDSFSSNKTPDPERTHILVRNHLEAHKFYPASARRRGIEGEVEISFALNGQGNTDKIEILAGSGYALLDQAAMQTVERSQPFPIQGGQYRFRLLFHRL